MINANLFEPVRAIFINGLKMYAVPVVLFSVIACFVGGSTDLPQMKRLGVILSALVDIAAVWLFSRHLQLELAQYDLHTANHSLYIKNAKIMSDNQDGGIDASETLNLSAIIFICSRQ